MPVNESFQLNISCGEPEKEQKPHQSLHWCIIVHVQRIPLLLCGLITFPQERYPSGSRMVNSNSVKQFCFHWHWCTVSNCRTGNCSLITSQEVPFHMSRSDSERGWGTCTASEALRPVGHQRWDWCVTFRKSQNVSKTRSSSYLKFWNTDHFFWNWISLCSWR